MMRYWRTHDLIDLFDSVKRGFIPLATRKFTNFSTVGIDEFHPIVQHDINWPTHMEPDFDKLNPGQFKVEDDIPIPKLNRNKAEWEDALFSLQAGKCLTIKLDSTMKEAQNLMIRIRNRISKYHPEMLKSYILRSVKSKIDKNIVVAVRVWKINLEDDK